MFALLTVKGISHFDETSLNLLSHALQCGKHALMADSGTVMITASLLHDSGHLINPKNI